MDRRSFLIRVGGTVAGTLTLVLFGCSGDDSSGPAGPSGPSADIGVGINANHGHFLALSRSDLSAGVSLDLTLTGPHSHDVHLSAPQVDQLLAGTAVSVTSTVSGHSHVVDFTP